MPENGVFFSVASKMTIYNLTQVALPTLVSALTQGQLISQKDVSNLNLMTLFNTVSSQNHHIKDKQNAASPLSLSIIATAVNSG